MADGRPEDQDGEIATVAVATSNAQARKRSHALPNGELGGWRDLKMVLRYARLAPSHLAPYAGNRGLVKPQNVENDQAQNRTHDIRLSGDEEETSDEWGG